MNGPFLTGRVDHSLDEKGRVTLPAAFRDVFLDDAYLVPSAHGEPFVRLYDPNSWRAHDDRYIASLDELGDAEADELISELYEGMYRIAPDKQGRVVIPQPIVEALGLNGKVRITGHRDHLRFWDPATHDRHREARERLRAAEGQRRSGGSDAD
jgi:MraZ protein